MTVKLTEKSEFSPAAVNFNWPENLARRWEHMGLPVLLGTAWQEGFVSGMGGRGVESEIPSPPHPHQRVIYAARAELIVQSLVCAVIFCTITVPFICHTLPLHNLLTVSYLKMSVPEDRGSNPDVCVTIHKI
jgi:hypothetical protein